MSDAVRELRWVSEADRLRARDRFAAVLAAWGAEWGVPVPALEVMNVVDLQAEADWRPVERGASAAPASALWQDHASAAAMWVAATMLGRAPRQGIAPTDWALEAAESALADLASRLVDARIDAAVALDLHQALAPYGGGVAVSAPSLGLRWLLVCESKARPTIEQAMPTAPQPLLELLGVQRVRVVLDLGQAEATLEDLMALQPGDVIRFPRPLAEPLPLMAGLTRYGAIQPMPVHCHIVQNDGRLHAQVAAYRSTTE